MPFYDIEEAIYIFIRALNDGQLKVSSGTQKTGDMFNSRKRNEEPIKKERKKERKRAGKKEREKERKKERKFICLQSVTEIC